MTVGELFVDLGVKGSEKTVQALGGVRGALKEGEGSSLALKAALAGVLYGLEQLMSQSSKFGMGLSNFNALTGESVVRLQKMQYAGQQAGASFDETASSFKALQTAMTQTALGGAPPEGLGIVSKATGLDMKRLKDTEYVWNKLQEFAQKAPPELATKYLKTFGIADNDIAAMRKGVFTEAMYSKAPAYSEKQVGALANVSRMWANLGTKTNMAVGGFTAKHGAEIVKDLDKLITPMVRLAEALTSFSEKAHIFEGLAKVIEAWTTIIGGTADTVADITNDKKGLAHGAGVAALGANTAVTEALWGAILTAKDALPDAKDHGGWERRAAGGGGGGTNVTVNQKMTVVGDPKDAKAAKDLQRQSAKNAYAQLPARKGGH